MAYTNVYGGGFGAVDPATMMYETEEERRRRLGLPSTEPMTTPVAPAMPAAAPSPMATETAALGSGIQIMDRGPNYDNLLTGAMVNDRVNQRLMADPNAPPDVKAMAADMARQRAENQRRELDAQKTLKSGDQNKIAAAMQSDDAGGNYLKLLAYKALGMTNLALQEERKLGAGRTVENVSSPDGKSRARITFDGMGQPIGGYDQTGRPLNQQELRAFATYRSDTAPQTGLPQKGELFVDRNRNAFREVFNPKDPNNPIMVPITPGTVPEGQMIRATQDPNLAAGQAGGRAYGSAAVEQTGQVPAQAPILGPAAPAFAQPVQPGQPVMATTPTPVQPSAPPAPSAAAAMPAPSAVAPTPVPAPAPTTTTQGPAALRPTTPQLSPVTGPTAPGGIVPPGQYKTQQAVSQTRQTEAIQTAETEPRENIKTNTALATEASKKARDAASQLSTIDRVIKYTETKPQFFGEWIGSDAYRAFRDSRTDTEQREALNRLAQLARIPEPDRPEFQKLMNDIRRLELSGITGSGLSATQLNTERESQRAVSAFAVSITDTAQAAKAQAMIARTGVEYNRAFNKYLGTANKRLSPATLQDDFDQRIGDKIYADLQKKLEAEIPRQAPAAGGNTGFSVLRRRPVQ
jgi:hypothetical protein